MKKIFLAFMMILCCASWGWAGILPPTNAGLPVSVDQTEAGYLDGVTSAIQAQLDSKVSAETDPITGAINGMVKADGAGNISSAVAETDYEKCTRSLVGAPTGIDDVVHGFARGACWIDLTAASVYYKLSTTGDTGAADWYRQNTPRSATANLVCATVDASTDCALTSILGLISGLSDTVTFEDADATTKKFRFDASPVTAGQTRVFLVPDADGTMCTIAATQELTNKTFSTSATGNVFKMTNYLILSHPHVCSAGAPIQTTSTANTFGQCKFGNATDKATNYAEYYVVIPSDIDTAVDLTATFKVKLSAADTGDHEYEISFDSVADSAAYAGTLGDAISLAFTADASGAQDDVETAGITTLTGWRSALTAGQLMVIRVARDGDHANDGSTVDSYSGPLVIAYGVLQ